MRMRPLDTRWFELLVAREELTAAVEVLAGTGSVELESRTDGETPISLPELQDRMEAYYQLARRYHEYWPHAELRPATRPRSPATMLDNALRRLSAWERVAAGWVQRLESLSGRRAELHLLQLMLERLDDDALDFALLSRSGPALAARLFSLPADSRAEQLPTGLLYRWVSTESCNFLLAVGLAGDLDALGAELAALKGHVVTLPADLSGNRPMALEQVKEGIADLDKHIAQAQQKIDTFAESYALVETLGELNRVDWFLSNVTSLPVSETFAWVTGWTDDLDGERLREALAQAKVHAMMRFPPPPRDVRPPMVMRNPRWAQPFEVFARMLGTPASDEADPSQLLAVLAPLLFGYMFGDVGQGLVLLIVGLMFQRRWPIFRILVANGFSSMIFGFVFGSVFGREDLVPALWVHPIEQPLVVLAVPLVGGVLIILLGLVLNAVECYWRRQSAQWWQVDAAVVVLYVSILASFFVPFGLTISVGALVWYFAGSLLQSQGKPLLALLGAAGSLIETVLQLLINTLSFVRVGAFALAHAGLSLAFNTLAAAMDSAFAGFLMLLLGNLVVIMLEGLVVTIQTTRLILFEFFIRFLRGTGRMFHPLAAPTSEVALRRIT